MTFRLTRKAENDLVSIYVSGVNNFGLAQADAYLDRLEKTFHTLGENPKLARERAEIQPPVRVYPCEEHLIIYDIDVQGVLILRVRHGREDWVSDPV